jgi:hypothetical protein
MTGIATHRYILEPYSGPRSRHTCPICGAPHEFSRYIDTENGNAYLDDRVGKCNRTNKCNHHYTPGQYFADNGFSDKFKSSGYKSRKARAAEAINRVFSLEPIPAATFEQKNALESEQHETQSKLERLQSQMKQYQAAFKNSPAQEYLISRGITAETAKAFRCGYAEQFKHWKETAGEWEIIGADRRVVFPITDQSGQVIAYHARAIDDNFIDTPKKTKGTRKEALFQTANAFDADIFFLVEGPADAMALHECGFAAVASAATSIPSWLPNRLAFRKVMVAFDADATGNRDAEKHISELRAHGVRAVRLVPEGGKDWNDVLLKVGKTDLRRFIEEKIAAAYPDYELLIEPEPQAENENFILEDVFTVGNESGQSVIDHLVKFSKKCEDAGKAGLLLSMPTVKAYKTELALVRGIAKNSHGELSDESLRILTETYIAAHLRSEDVSDQWTGDDVPLLYLTLRLNGERLESVTCNKIQSWIVREYWLRQSPEAEFGAMDL